MPVFRLLKTQSVKRYLNHELECNNAMQTVKNNRFNLIIVLFLE